jgi:hypothetical protein
MASETIRRSFFMVDVLSQIAMDSDAPTRHHLPARPPGAGEESKEGLQGGKKV